MNTQKILFFTLLALNAYQSMQAQYYSQIGQDKYLHTAIFLDKKDGVYVEIGAFDGIKYSNTYFFEQLGWHGMCIEPIAERFQQLCKNRNENCICIQGCISNATGPAQFLHVKGHCEMLSGLTQKFDPRHIDRINYEATANRDSVELQTVPCYKLNDLLQEHGFYHVDFLSIDTEGSELDILRSIDFNTFDIDVIMVEDNYGYPEIHEFLKQQGFALITTLEHDLLFRNKRYYTTPN